MRGRQDSSSIEGCVAEVAKVWGSVARTDGLAFFGLAAALAVLAGGDGVA